MGQARPLPRQPAPGCSTGVPSPKNSERGTTRFVRGLSVEQRLTDLRTANKVATPSALRSPLYRLVHLVSSTPSRALSSASQSLHHAPLSLKGSGARLTARE